MICPYCVEEVPSDATKHDDCKIEKGKDFPLFYLDYHRGDNAEEPVVLSVVGIRAQGKTVYLGALFDFLSTELTQKWPGFYISVLDQDSLTKLDINLGLLREGKLPPHTKQSFPRPGIFRLCNMPHREDTTILIYDPPGEAFEDDEKVVEWAGFVKRSKAVLFLIDLPEIWIKAGDRTTEVWKTATKKMEDLLSTYILGRRKMGIKGRFQDLIVVYTKADAMPVCIPSFKEYLAQRPGLKSHLNEKTPERITSPANHLKHLEEISGLLEKFTREELKANNFINMIEKNFLSVSYTAVTSLGVAPIEDNQGKRLRSGMAPRCVADPLLLVLDKSVVNKLPPPTPPIEEEVISPSWQHYLRKFRERFRGRFGVPASIVLGLLLLIALMSKACGSIASDTVSLFESPGDDKSLILKAPRNTKLIPSGDTFHTSSFWWLGFGNTLLKVKIENQDCQIGIGVECSNAKLVTVTNLKGWIAEMAADGKTQIIKVPKDTSDDYSRMIDVKTGVWVRDQAGSKIGKAIAVLPKGTSVTLTDAAPQSPSRSPWREIIIQDKVCGVCPPNGGNNLTVRIRNAEGWVDKALLDQ